MKHSPKFKKLKRKARLQSGAAWLKEYEGKHILQGYCKRYGVDKECALKELSMLGVEFETEYVQAVRASLRNEKRRKEERKERTFMESESSGLPDSDEDFVFIAGHTANGFAYGVRRGESTDSEQVSSLNSEKLRSSP